MGPRRRVLRRLLRNPQFLVGGAIVALLVLAAALAPWLAPHDPFARDGSARLQPPSASHPFGTDLLGRDLFSQIIYGSRLTLYVGAISVAISLSVGLLLGVTAGYFRGWWDQLVSGLLDVLLTFPSFLLALGIVAILGPSLTNAMIAVGIQGVPAVARVVRGEVLQLRGMEFVEAARSAGATDARIMFRTVLPNTVSSVLVMATLQFPFAILMTAGLSFLGLGAQPPTTEWAG